MKKLPDIGQKVAYKPGSVLDNHLSNAFFLVIFLMKAEIAPSYKFKLAVNRGLPCLKSHDLSGGLLLRRCTLCYTHQGSCGYLGSVCALRHKLPLLSCVAY